MNCVWFSFLGSFGSLSIGRPRRALFMGACGGGVLSGARPAHQTKSTRPEKRAVGCVGDLGNRMQPGRRRPR